MNSVITIPNILSVFRLVFVFLFLFTFYHNMFKTAIIFLAISILTDFFDGLLARVLKQKTKLGTFLDPLADKFLIITSIIVLMSKNFLPWWFFGIIITREIMVSIGWLITYQHTMSFYTKPRFLGKTSMCLEMITLVVIILNAYLNLRPISESIQELFFITSLFAVGSLIDYIIYARKKIYHK